MSTILAKLNRRFASIKEEEEHSWKDPYSPDYDRQWAEDALYHTIGPLTNTPIWNSSKWTSTSKDGEPVPGFDPGQPAPQWTPDEVIFAMAGDPDMLFRGQDHPASPLYGNKGGAPLWRWALRIARIYNRGRDKNFIQDAYQNGSIALVRMMQPGFDEGRSPFISYVQRYIISAMENGPSQSEQEKMAGGLQGTYYTDPRGIFTKRIGNAPKEWGGSFPHRGPGEEESDDDYDAYKQQRQAEWAAGHQQHTAIGVAKLMTMTNPRQVREAAKIVKGKYRTERSYDADIGNPFMQHSADYYQLANEYADALESRNEDEIDRVRSKLAQLKEAIDDEKTAIRGASTNSVISTKDRAKEGGIGRALGVQSMDVSDTEGGTAAGNVVGDEDEESSIDPESINFVFKLAMTFDVASLIRTSDKYNQMALDAVRNPNTGDVPQNCIDRNTGRANIGGLMSANELRYAARSMGPLGSNYYGRDKVRRNVRIPRDTPPRWWRPGEDPEIEPIPDNGGLWHSIWKREGYQPIRQTAIAREMTAEVFEFRDLGISTKRWNSRVRDGGLAISSVSVGTQLAKGKAKLIILGNIHRYQLGMDFDESLIRDNPILEDINNLDPIDRTVIATTCESMVKAIDWASEPESTFLNTNEII
jgi:hypothetical protein